MKFLLAKNEVKLDNQRLFYTTVSTRWKSWRHLPKDREDRVNVLKTHWDLDQGRSLEDRVQVAACNSLCIHQCSFAFTQKAAEVGCRVRGAGQSQALVPSEWTAMRQVLEKKYGLMDEKATPT